MKTLKTSYDFRARSRCPACHSPDGTTVYSNPFNAPPISDVIRSHYGVDPDCLSRAPYKLVRCGCCSLIYQDWVGDDELLSELYERWIADHADPDTDPGFVDNIRYPAQSRDGHELMAAAAYLQRPTNELVTLDFGMGWGLWARIARALGCDSYGFDLSRECMRYASERGVKVLAEDRIGNERFHFINTEQVMEHVTEPLEVARELAGALLPGGILKVSVPSGDGVQAIIERLKGGTVEGLRDEVMPVFPLEHVNCYTSRSLDVLASNLGLEIVRPSLFQRYSFIGRHDTLSLRRPREALKELARPVYQYRNARNLYVWMRKPD